ncbi:MAG: F0F1 ATP synthase subunit delta [Burkholderiales bacterium]
MAELVTIARPYAEAAFRIAREKSAFDQWSDMLRLLATIVQDERIARSVGDPNVSGRQLESVIVDIGGNQLDDAGRNFVRVLTHNNRLTALPAIHDLFQKLRLEHEGVLEAKIQSAFAIDSAQVGELVKKLESKYQRKVRAEVSVDPQLIGGVKIVIGDKVFDATVRGKLDAMSNALSR